MDETLKHLKAKARRRHGRDEGEGTRRHHLAAVAHELGFDGWPHLLAVLN